MYLLSALAPKHPDSSARTGSTNEDTNDVTAPQCGQFGEGIVDGSSDVSMRSIASAEANSHPLPGAPHDAACSLGLFALNEQHEAIRNIQRAHDL
jgi:hypothetical protein